MKKSLKLAAAAVIAALSLCTFKPVRVWASQEGSYIFHAIYVNGPGVFYGSSWKGNDGVTYTGVTVSTGTPTAPAGTVMHFLGAVSSKPATSSEGDFGYDSTLHAVFFATGTSTGNDKFVRAVTSGSSWTIY